MWCVSVPRATIQEAPDLYVKTGSAINLTCVIYQSPEPPVFVFWYHDERMINYDPARGDITIRKAPGDRAVSRLYIRNAQSRDSGNYTCCPSNADATSISVHVLNGMSTFTFDTQFFKQTKGSPMGSPLSTVVAEVVMRSLDQWITSRHSSDIFLWRRYIDDTFCLEGGCLEPMKVVGGTSEEKVVDSLVFLVAVWAGEKRAAMQHDINTVTSRAARLMSWMPLWLPLLVS
ncbi:hypothetical protein LAZ67_19000566 [Cordylochernes scorpioides]|uniref:Ig-like domain-containing protein n=1 Tax=Cordylochernes scorpioides TaxID=51811 RepID=A0ABY6LH95_9ARAC|nr:hypothetical protein LAZ67_19000566 [Cordylochernes scorpioides]